MSIDVDRCMAKRDSQKEQLKKAAKKRRMRASDVASQPAQTFSDGEGGPTKRSRALNLCIDALLTLDRLRDDVNDRAVLVGLKSVLRGYPGNEPAAAAVYHSIAELRKTADLQPHPVRAAIDELLGIITAYGNDRQTPRAALTYLNSMTS